MTIQFKRGSSARWLELNPILADGEPGYDTDKGRLKIGDGVTPWTDLLFQDEKAVISRADYYSFPSIGSSNTIYKEESTGKIYQWIDNHYEVIKTEVDLDITLINGGDANGNT